MYIANMIRKIINIPFLLVLGFAIFLVGGIIEVVNIFMSND